MPKKSAGILVYRFKEGSINFLLAHPGGPFFAKKDIGVWSIPKGEFEEEEPLQAAIREFKEELGKEIAGAFVPLTPIKIKSGKTIYAFAVESNMDVQQITSNAFKLEWPIKSGNFKEFPEVDKAEWFDIEQAKVKINQGQLPLINELILKLKQDSNPS